MFIKVFVPNANGKIELSVKELEALIQEAVDKAIVEDRANRPYNYGGLITYCNSKDTDKTWDPYKVTCQDDVSSICGHSTDTVTLNSTKGV
jgi:hypothetical protein